MTASGLNTWLALSGTVLEQVITQKNDTVIKHVFSYFFVIVTEQVPEMIEQMNEPLFEKTAEQMNQMNEV